MLHMFFRKLGMKMCVNVVKLGMKMWYIIIKLGMKMCVINMKVGMKMCIFADNQISSKICINAK